MSLEIAKQFLNYLDYSVETQAKLNLAGWNSDLMMQLATANGFPITASSLFAAIDEMWGTLSEEELVNAAGGGDNELPHDNPPLGQTDRSGGWTPPPGDVSGNPAFSAGSSLNKR